MSNSVQITCQHCPQQVQLAQSDLGKQFACPTCGKNQIAALPAPLKRAQPLEAAPAAISVDNTPQIPAAISASVATPSPAVSDSVGPMIVDTDANSAVARVGRSGKKKPDITQMLVFGGVGVAGVLVLLAVVGALMMGGSDDGRPFELYEVPQQIALVNDSVALKVNLLHPLTKGGAKFELAKAPAGANIDAQSGAFTWTPGSDAANATHEVIVRALDKGRVAETKFNIRVNFANRPPVFTASQPAAATSGQAFVFQVEAADPDTPARAMRYRLASSAPAGFALDSQTGEIRWTPTIESIGETVAVSVEAKEHVQNGLSATHEFSFAVVAGAAPLDQWIAGLRADGSEVEVSAIQSDPAVQLWEIAVGEEPVLVAKVSDSLPQELVGEMIAEIGKEIGRKTGAAPDAFRSDATALFYAGENDGVRAAIQKQFGNSLPTSVTSIAGNPSPPMTEQPSGLNPPLSPLDPPATSPDPPELPTQPPLHGLTAAEQEKVLAWYDDGSLFKQKNYSELRSILAAKFEREHQAEITQAFGSENDEMAAWLTENVELKEELYLAFHPRDDVARGLALFREIKEAFPDKIAQYGNLAIAIAVVWDRPDAVYDYKRHQVRAKADMPANHLDALGNFEYFLNTERAMQGRGQWLPWEFLIHAINHTTPADERMWALENYVSNRSMFGQCYSEVPYDHLMLETGSAQGKLNGSVYNLPNIKKIGGVCAHQADFASRVGKSMAVPAAYVAGESNSGDRHAWVMWVEITRVTQANISFRLESHGRYQGDQYYVGTLLEPQTGLMTTDRRLELELQSVGLSPTMKRHADRLVALMPFIEETRELNASDQIDYLDRTLKLCPVSRSAWLQVSQLSGEEEVQQEQARKMASITNHSFNSLGYFPDFTWELFGDLTRYETSEKARIALYNRLVLHYIKVGRPDLGCEALLELTDMLTKEDRQREAIDALANMIKAFPNEGRYVPRMLDRLESICQVDASSTPHLLAFYDQFLPLIKQMRGTAPSKYCMQMFERGIALFKLHGQTQAAAVYENQLALIRAGQGRNE